MAPPTALAAKAKQCLAKAAPIPGAPAWHMARGNADDKAIMQNAIDYLTCKAEAKMPFTEDEKHFLVELFEAFWWGGKGTNIFEATGIGNMIGGILEIGYIQGMPEAAELANHYVHGNGKTLVINPGIYKSSVIVRDTMAAMKAFIRESVSKGIPVPVLRSGDPKFMRSPHCAKLHKSRRDEFTQGYVLFDGALKTEEMNKRLHYADNRFHLHAYSQAFVNFLPPLFSTSVSKTPYMCTRWRVEETWDYQSFEKTSYASGKAITDIPMGYKREHRLRLPDGLSHYMTVLGVAKEFKYWAEWSEKWDL